MSYNVLDSRRPPALDSSYLRRGDVVPEQSIRNQWNRNKQDIYDTVFYQFLQDKGQDDEPQGKSSLRQGHSVQNVQGVLEL